MSEIDNLETYHADDSESVQPENILQPEGRYSLYCVLLATTSDESVCHLLEEMPDELSRMSGSRCCFLWCRSIETAKYLVPISFDEHLAEAYRLARVFSIPLADFPGVVFYEAGGDHYVYVGLRDLSPRDIVTKMRAVFDRFDGAAPRTTLKAIAKGEKKGARRRSIREVNKRLVSAGLELGASYMAKMSSR